MITTRRLPPHPVQWSSAKNECVCECVQDDGKYSAGATCEPVMCPPFEPPEHGSVSPAGPVAKGDSVHIECDPGYEPAEPDMVDVICDGEWGQGTTCVPIAW